MLKFLLWCRRGDSNPHELPHTPLKRARLPVPPLRHEVSLEGCGHYSRKSFQSNNTTCSPLVKLRVLPVKVVARAPESESVSMSAHSPTSTAKLIVSRSGSANRARERSA